MTKYNLNSYVLSFLPLIATLLALTPTDSAIADDNLDCRVYATKAVAQQEKNQLLGCGLKGVGWSTNFQEHFNWCKLPQVKITHVTEADRIRKNAINKCSADKKRLNVKGEKKRQADHKKKMDVKCGQYAIQARDQFKVAQKHKCGFAGGRWSNNVNGHRAWCLKAGLTAAANETNTRKNALAKCTEVKAFRYPKGRKVKGRRWPLDVCTSYERLFCTETVAENFCKKMGYRVAAYWVTDSASSPPGSSTTAPAVVSSFLDHKGYCGGRKCTFFIQINCKHRN